MEDETWSITAVPLLNQVLQGGRDDPQATTCSIIQQANGEPTINSILAALIEDGYIAGAGVFWVLGRGDPIITPDILRLTPKGRGAVGDWPSGSEAGDLLIRTLEARLARLPEGERKSGLARLLDAAREVGTEVLTGVLSKVVRGMMGLPWQKVRTPLASLPTQRRHGAPRSSERLT